MTKVLVVDDEPTVREVVAGYLRRDGHEVSEAADGTIALELLDSDPPDLVVLDMMLPGVNGLDILRRVRASGDIPVIMLTARAEESDRVAGLELGADDYVVKPFSPRELAARVNGVLRRTNGRQTPALGPIVHGALVIEPLSRQVTLASTIIEMTPKESSQASLGAGAMLRLVVAPSPSMIGRSPCGPRRPTRRMGAPAAPRVAK